MPQQLTFDLPVRAALGRDDFFVSDANRDAVMAVDNWQEWPSGKLLLVGRHGAGKTHLAHVWAAEANAQVIDAQALEEPSIPELAAQGGNIALENIDQIAENTDAQHAAFHLHNLLLAEGGRLLITTLQPPAAHAMSLPDLQSRLLGTNSVRLLPPDDALLSAVMVKLFADRQIEVPPNVITYLADRIERSIGAATQVVDALDRLALIEKRPISRTLAARVMDNPSAYDA